jgi:hypothetical protein
MSERGHSPAFLRVGDAPGGRIKWQYEFPAANWPALDRSNRSPGGGAALAYWIDPTVLSASGSAREMNLLMRAQNCAYQARP